MTGSYVLNVKDAPAHEHPISGITIDFDRPGEPPFRDTGVNIVVLQPGQPSCKYHAESVQEDFLVLGGSCLLLLEGEERPLVAWDFVHCEPGAAHVFIGAGGGPCWILQIGARREGSTLEYPVTALAARYGASSPGEDVHPYSDWPDEYTRVTPPWPPAF